MEVFLILCFVCIASLSLSSIFLSHRLSKLEKYYVFVKDVFPEIDE